MIRNASFIAAGIVMAIGVGTPSIATACTGCGPGCGHEFFPGFGRDVPDIPANAGLVWHVTSESSEAEVLEPNRWVTVERFDDATLTPVDFGAETLDFNTFLIKPVDGWEDGERYRVAVDISASDTRCATGSPQAVKEVIAGPPLDADPGELRVVGCGTSELQVEAAAECETVIEAAVCSIQYEVELGRWDYREVMFTETFVDGERWAPRDSFCADIPPGATWRGRMRDDVFAGCGGQFGLGEGEHRVQMHLYVPGTDWEHTSEEVEFTLECPDEAGDASLNNAPIVDGGADDAANNARRDLGGERADGGGAATAERGCSVTGGRTSFALLAICFFVGLVRRRR